LRPEALVLGRADPSTAEHLSAGECRRRTGIQERCLVALIAGQRSRPVDPVVAREDPAEHAAETVGPADARSGDAEVGELCRRQEAVLT
jgi:hypothetical protein